MSDREQKLNWQSWQPQSLLDEDTQPEDEIIHLPGDYQPDELLQAELSRLRQQAEKKDSPKGRVVVSKRVKSRAMKPD